MMRKFKKIIVCLLAAFLGLVSVCFVGDNEKSAYAETESQIKTKIKQSVQTELENFIEKGISVSEKTRYSRIAGSEAEYNAALYIKNQLSTLTNYKPVNNESTIGGIERFDFTSIHDGKRYSSQNVIFKRESLINTNRKIVIGAHYDTAYIDGEKTDYSSGIGLVGDGVNDNAASVATLIALVKELDKETFDYGYDIEIVFFGAGANDYEGSAYYVRGQSKQDAKDTLLMINLDRIGLGKYNYAYVNEFKTTQEKYLFDRLYGFKKLKQINVLDFSMKSPNGLNYTHIGLESDHSKFMSRNINVLSFFSGNYEQAMTLGIKEYEGENVTYTQNDSYSYIFANYKDSFYSNLVNVYQGIKMVISDSKFVAEMERPNGLEEKYDFWTNKKLAVFITTILFIVFVFIYIIIFTELKKKSKEAANSSDVSQIVVKITDNLMGHEEDQELNDVIDQKIKGDTEDKETKDDNEEK